MSDNIYKLGIIGAGAIVELAHLPILKSIKTIDVKWICDINADNCTLLSSMYNVNAIDINNIDQGLENIDICLLTVPYGARPMYIEKIARRNCALYVEKPFAISINEHQQLMQNFPLNRLAIGYQRRYFQVVEELKNIIDDDIYGSLLKITFLEGNFHIKGNKSYLSDYKMAGGGIIIESAIHALDQLLIILIAKDVTVHNVQSLAKDKIDYDTTVKGEILANQGYIKYDIAISNLRNFDNGLYLEFENATLKCDLSVNANIYIKSKNSDKWYTITQNNNSLNYPSSINEAFKFIWEDFLSALNTGKPNYSSAINSTITTKWIEQIYKHV